MYKDGQKMWGEILASLKLSTSPVTFKTWFSGSYVMDYKDIDGARVLVVGVKSSFLKEQIEKRYLDKIKDILFKKGDTGSRVMFVVSQKEVGLPAVGSGPLFSGVAIKHIQSSFNSEAINPNHTFENFIVGPSNNLAFLAANQVAGQIGKVYNPLLFYGPTGVGKTHLLQAIGNEVLTKYDDAKILYITAEKFTNDYLESLANRTQAAFRNKYRSVHVLVIDDIQFLAGKESTQDEFFHTFNDLYLSGKQIIAASDKHPKELGKLKERLMSRFLGGMCADLSLPDYEMKVAIIRAKCAERGFVVEERVVDLIASECAGGARELEGMLTSTLAMLRISKNGAGIEELRDIVSKNKPKSIKITKEDLIDAVSKHFETNIIDLASSSRKARLVFARQVLMYLLRSELAMPLVTIGDLLGGRDHSTIIHGVYKIADRIKSSSKIKDEVLRVKNLSVN